MAYSDTPKTSPLTPNQASLGQPTSKHASGALGQSNNPALPSTKGTESAVSWSAVMAGAAVIAALSLILLILGTGLGLSSVSPWASSGASATAIGVSTVLWLTVTQLIASGMGGYLTGRLRTRYVVGHSDEVYFRDTAHGFLAWSVASLVTASLLASAVGTIVSAGASVASGVAGGAVSTVAVAGAAATSMKSTGSGSANPAAFGSSVTNLVSDPASYLLDSMFRKSPGAAAPIAGSSADSGGTASPSEIARIFMNSVQSGALSTEDAKYVAATVAAKAGITPEEAEARVKATYDRLQGQIRDAAVSAKQAADTARKATAYAALWLFISLLIGAFFASWGATLGGRHRDV